MGVFANSILNENTNFYGVEDVLRNVTNYQFDESASIMEACMTGILESECNWRDMLANISAKEYSVLESTGREMVYEGVDIRGIFNKIIEFFKKIWAKIAGLFQKFLTFISSKVSNDKKFIQANEKKIRAGFNTIPSEGIRIKGYKYTNLNSVKYLMPAGFRKSDIKDLIMKSTATADDLKNELKEYKEQRTQTEDEIRAKILGDSSKDRISASEFARVAKEYLRGEEISSYKGAESGMSCDDIIAEIKDGKYSKTNAKNEYNLLKAALNYSIAEVKNLQNNILKNSDDKLANLKMSVGNISINTLKCYAITYQQLSGIQLNLMAARHAQARSIAAKLINLGVKAESVSFDSEDMESLFEV